MANSAEGIYYPNNEDMFDPAVDMERLAKSVRGLIVPVGSLVAANDYVARRTSEGRSPSLEDPVFVTRTDAGGDLQVNFGSGWRTIAGSTAWLQFERGTGWTYVEDNTYLHVRRSGVVVDVRPFKMMRTASLSVTAGNLHGMGTIQDGYRPPWTVIVPATIHFASNTPTPAELVIEASGAVYVRSSASGTLDTTSASAVYAGGFSYPLAGA